MAYSVQGFETMAASKYPRLLFYVSADALATVEGSGYFNDSATMLPSEGIIIHVDTNLAKQTIYAYTNTGSAITLITATKYVLD